MPEKLSTGELLDGYLLLRDNYPGVTLFRVYDEKIMGRIHAGIFRLPKPGFPMMIEHTYLDLKKETVNIEGFTSLGLRAPDES